jgi:hypothetical protein
LVVWYEQAGDNLSRTHSQLEISLKVLEILTTTSGSSRWGPLLPEPLLSWRIQNLNEGINALRLSDRTNPISRLYGKLLLLYLRGRDTLHRCSPAYPRMITSGT